MSREFTEETYQQIEAYILHSMSEEERTDFEKRMAEDVGLKKEVLLQQSIHNTFKKGSKSSHLQGDEALAALTAKMHSEEYQRSSLNIKQAAEAYFVTQEEQKNRKNRFPLYSIAAAAAVLLIIGLWFLLTDNPSASEYQALAHWEDVPSQIEKGDEPASVVDGEELFRTGKYDQVIDFYAPSEGLSPYAMIYLGISYLEIDEHEKALEIFDRLIESETTEYSRGYWYKLLTYLKQDNKEKAMEMLEIILSSEEHYNYDKALLLSKKWEGS